MEKIPGMIALFLVAGFFGTLIYVCLFRARDSNMPTASRGIGIVMLSGALKVIFLLLAEYVSEIFNAGFFDTLLIISASIGMLMLMSGLGGNE